jgi:predicted Zn-dependent protease
MIRLRLGKGSVVMGALVCLATASALLWSCATPNAYDAKRDALAKEEQKKLDDFRAELEIGRNMAGRLLQFYGTANDAALLDYVNQVASYVGTFSEHPERRYMVEILNSDMVNAFACPGGYILVTMGAIRNAKNEAELAAVLGHEEAHVGKKHMFEKLKSMSAEDLEKANELAKEKLKLPEHIKARARPKPEDSQLGDVMAKYLAGGAAGLSIVKAAGAGMAVILDQGLGAEKEFEADTEGVKYAINAGYDPKALTDFLCRLEMRKPGGKCELDKSKDSKKATAKTMLDKTHPPTPVRIANINKQLEKLDAGAIVGAKGEERFQKFHKRLPKAKAASH